MKFCIIQATIFCFAALSFAAPLMDIVDINDLTERSYDIDELDAREWYGIEARTGPFFPASASFKKELHSFIDEAKVKGELYRASQPGSSAKTYKVGDRVHLDRQQPTNANGQHKVAVQMRKVRAGQSSTLGQVAIHGGASPNAKLVAKKLKHSVRTGRETHINHPNSRKAKNIAENKKQQQSKADRNQKLYNEGMENAAKGIFKKGRK